MNEEPKSIWKKSWPTPRWFRIWLILYAATFLILFAIVGLSGLTGAREWPFAVGAAFGFSVVVATIMLCLWMCVRWLSYFVRRRLCWLNFKRLFFSLACLATLIALFYAEEDWRGKHAWEKFKREWEAKGERFDRASVVPSPVPDDQNFALTPIVASCYLHVLDKSGHQIRPQLTNIVNRLKMEISRGDDSPTNGTGNWQRSTVTDLKVWQQYYRALAAKTNEFPVPAQPQSPATDALLALSKYDPAIEELRQASQMPYSRFPLEYDSQCPAGIWLPHLSVLKGCARVLGLRASAELQNGQSDGAQADVKLMFRLAESVRTEPVPLSHLVRIAISQIALQPVWEGLAEHKWSDSQLAELDRELAGVDFPTDYKLVMRGQMVFFHGGVFDWLRHQPDWLPGILSSGGDSDTHLPARICWLIPSGWFYQNQLRCARPVLGLYLPVADVNQGIISPAAARHAVAVVEADTKHTTLYNIMERLLVPVSGGMARRFASGQAIVDLARVAIAAERYRLVHGAYPESLDALAPQFIVKLPHDVINGQPLHYRRTGDGQFVLYSVGWNETDDGGVVALREGGNIDFEKGDWVWRYPATQ